MVAAEEPLIFDMGPDMMGDELHTPQLFMLCRKLSNTD